VRRPRWGLVAAGVVLAGLAVGLVLRVLQHEGIALDILGGVRTFLVRPANAAHPGSP
jgi:hypothetical protein